jgi:6-phosphofructokinase 1
MSDLSWLRVDTWTTLGGSELGTNRTLPSVDIGQVAAAFKRHNIDCLLVIGGFESFHSVLILEQNRAHYPSLQIPMIHLPATLSNNVPLTDFSLGSGTSLNALVDACDAIKQSASGSRNRVFVVDTQGGQSGIYRHAWCAGSESNSAVASDPEAKASNQVGAVLVNP